MKSAQISSSAFVLTPHLIIRKWMWYFFLSVTNLAERHYEILKGNRQEINGIWLPMNTIGRLLIKTYNPTPHHPSTWFSGRFKNLLFSFLEVVHLMKLPGCNTALSSWYSDLAEASQTADYVRYVRHFYVIFHSVLVVHKECIHSI